MDRRDFIKNVGLTSTSLCCFPGLAKTTSGTATPVNARKVATIASSIHANFGSGFELVDYVEVGDSVHANIKNRENHYLVTSTDLAAWQIHSATTM